MKINIGLWCAGTVFCLLLVAFFFLPVHNFFPDELNGSLVEGKTTGAGSFAKPSSTLPNPSPDTQASPATAPVYQYNSQGQIQMIIYPNGSTYTYSYNANGDKIREGDGAGNNWTYAYDQNHHPLTVIDPKGHITHESTSLSPDNK
jgi:YD repeat-containing protein